MSGPPIEHPGEHLDRSGSRGPVLSVRAEARATVASDSASVACSLVASRPDAAAALAAVAAALSALTAQLSVLGGTALTPAAVRSPLTWSARSARTEAQHAADETTGQWRATGLTTATVDLVIGVREPGLLDGVGRALAAGAGVEVHGTRWAVDEDNPAWTLVRADAIRAAIAKGRDYAAALGAGLERLEQVADTGLLGSAGDADGWVSQGSRKLSSMSGSGSGQPGTPAPDPVPQELTATIEARFVTTAVALDAL